MIRLFFLFAGVAVGVVNAQDGPGSGPWVEDTPESQGLSTAALTSAESGTNNRIRGRTCYLVIKNGKLVFERYRGSGGIPVRRAAYSCTKSMCGSLYGIAVQQGWANVNDRVSARNSGTRRCNNQAEFRHVLTMTGESSNLNNPRFSYDTDGTRCLDTISDFIAQNNPDGLSTVNWKNRFWHDVLGMESMQWTGNNLGCGYGASTTCRDLARAAQLYLNDGAWAGAGQVMNQQYARDARTQIFNSGTAYGYTVWRQTNDPVDPDVSSFNGMYSQCAYISKVHEAIIVSMGQGDITGAACSNAWAESRNAIVGKDVRHLFNATLTPEQIAAEQKGKSGMSHEEILEMADVMLANSDDFPESDIRQLKEYLVQHGVIDMIL